MGRRITCPDLYQKVPNHRVSDSPNLVMSLHD